MYNNGDVIDGKYKVGGVCSDAGGMGCILHVTPLNAKQSFAVVLKYCRETDAEQLARFRREVRLLDSFNGNMKVVQIIDHNLEHDPPYFIMRFYPDGDLSKRHSYLQASPSDQEATFFQMIECLQELHSRNVYHRDIKPQNFLMDDEDIAVSDFGLTTEIGSNTAFTRSSVYWGTHGYIPPEFLQGGFKHADAAGDIFMLGKTMYVLLTGRDPMYLLGDNVPAPVFHVIERCCNISKSLRYQTLAELKQSLSAAYDVVLGRAGGLGKIKQLLSSIEDRLEQERKYSSSEVADFIEELALLEERDQVRVCFELSRRFFSVIRQGPLIGRASEFLSIYEKLVDSCDYSWSYAETIASNMRVIFSGEEVPTAEKAAALDLAIRAANNMNRFAAMDTCRAMVSSVHEETLGLAVAAIIMKYGETFIADIEPSECNSDAIRNALNQIKGK